jgi:hypothetical protein
MPVRPTPFLRILAIYGVALLVLLLWPISTRPISHSAKNFLISVCRVLQVDYVLAEPAPSRLGGDHDRDRDFPVRDHETITKSFALPAAHRSIEVDNVFGSIEVVGGTSDQVELTVQKTLRAESKEAMELAKKEVTLDITQQEGLVKLYVNGPFRCHCDDDCRGRRDREGYIVKMDFQLHVPRDIDTKVKTVNEGRVVVRNVAGAFSVRNVNGDIQMENVAGSGIAHTVNGPVKVTFRENPRENSSFQSINGNIELSFARGLSADFRFKTFNGGVYSDFPVTALPAHALKEDHEDGKTVFRADRFTGARVSSGGPEIEIENLNGDIRILENHE